MSKGIEKEELEKCKSDMFYFFKKYVLVNGQETTMTNEQFQDMVMTWKTPKHSLNSRRPYTSWDGSLNDCGDANEY
jgi:hypothetical protein